MGRLWYGYSLKTGSRVVAERRFWRQVLPRHGWIKVMLHSMAPTLSSDCDSVSQPPHLGWYAFNVRLWSTHGLYITLAIGHRPHMLHVYRRSLLHCLGQLGASQPSSRPKMASEVAPGRQELPLSMRLSLWSGWVGEQLICSKSLGRRTKICPWSPVPWASIMPDFLVGDWPDVG